MKGDKVPCGRCKGNGLDPEHRAQLFSGGQARALCSACGGTTWHWLPELVLRCIDLYRGWRKAIYAVNCTAIGTHERILANHRVDVFERQYRAMRERLNNHDQQEFESWLKYAHQKQ